MDTKNILESRLFRAVILSVAGLIILVLVFGMGVFVGSKKAEFSFRWADQYHRIFAGPQGGFFNDFMQPGQEFTNSNGVFGQIIKIGDNTLTVEDRDNTEKIVLTDSNTTIIFQRQNIKLSDLKVDDTIVVIGDPDDNGQIHAKLIRVMPAGQLNLPEGNESEN